MKYPLEGHVGEAAVLLHEMASEVRLQILIILIGKEMDVGTLAQAVNLGQSALSQHLKRLRDAELVTTRRDRQNVYYSCKSHAVAKLLKTLADIASDSDASAL